MRSWLVLVGVIGLVAAAGAAGLWILGRDASNSAEDAALEAKLEDIFAEVRADAAAGAAAGEDVGDHASGRDRAVVPAPTAEGKTAQHAAHVPEPDSYRMDDYRSPVPLSLKGAKTIDVEEAITLWQDKAAVFIDVYPRAPKPPNLPKNTVWRDPPHKSIEGAIWLPNVGYGVLSGEVANYFKANLERLTDGDKAKPVVFFCLRDCWMSWNAAKRAVEWGYSSVIWFSEGTDAWQEAGRDLVYVQKLD